MTDPATSPWRLAVATKDGSLVDLHFGQADAFAVYEAHGESPSLLETRVVEHYCQGGFGDEDKREVILRALADCSALFVARVGDGPRRQLECAGIQAIDEFAHHPVDEALRTWIRRAADKTSAD